MRIKYGKKGFLCPVCGRTLKYVYMHVDAYLVYRLDTSFRKRLIKSQSGKNSEYECPECGELFEAVEVE